MDMEKEYNIRAGLPDHPALLAAWDARSAGVREKMACLTDVTYGDGSRQTLDFFPALDPDAPLVVYIHGGYWYLNDKSRFSFIAEGLVHDGCSVAMINYPLCPDVRVGDIGNSVQHALTFLREASKRMRFDVERMFLVGHSAGAHLAATTLTGDNADTIKGTLAISGIYDLRPLVGTSMNESLRLTEAEAEAVSPMFMQPRTTAPVLLAVGGLESSEFHRQSRECATAWGGSGVQVAELDITPRHHLDILEDLAAPDGTLRKALGDMVFGR